MMNGDGSGLSGVTEGDSIDEAPSWIPGKQRRILFQSSGVGRNKHGYIVGRGPASIQAVDLDKERVTGVLEEADTTFSSPASVPTAKSHIPTDEASFRWTAGEERPGWF